MRNLLVRDKLISLVLIAVLAVTFTFSIGSIPSYAASNVIIGHAATGENGTKNQEAGDQTGKEVYTCAWTYSTTNNNSRNWTIVVRCQTTSKAKRIAQVVKDACDNNNVGYDQNGYKTFYDALKKTGDISKPSTWDASKITDKVETTCTPLIASAVQAAGISLGDKVGYESKALAKELAKTGEFTLYCASEDSLYNELCELVKNNNGKVLVNSEMVTTDKHLVPGDILLSMHPHGAVVVSSPNSSSLNAVEKKSVTSTGKSDFGYKVGSNYKTIKALNVRCGPGGNFEPKTISQLTADGQKNATKNSDGNAALNANTEITVLDVSGKWVRIPSGWITGGTSKGTKYLKAVTTTKKTTKKTTTKVTVKVGKDYKLKLALYVRKGPGTNYKTIKRSALSASAKKYAVTGITAAKFKKGTVVTCLEKKGDWMRVPSGWICCKQGNVANA